MAFGPVSQSEMDQGVTRLGRDLAMTPPSALGGLLLPEMTFVHKALSQAPPLPPLYMAETRLDALGGLLLPETTFVQKALSRPHSFRPPLHWLQLDFNP